MARPQTCLVNQSLGLIWEVLLPMYLDMIIIMNMFLKLLLLALQYRHLKYTYILLIP